MSYYAPGMPAVYTALRGLCYAEISVRTLAARPALGDATAGWRPTRSRRWSGSWPSSRTPTARSSIPKLYKAVRAALRRRSSRPGSKLPFDEEAFLARGGHRAGPHRPEGLLGPRADLGAADLRDPRHPRRVRGRRRQDGHSRAGDREGEPAAGAGADATRRSGGSSSAPSRALAPRWADVKVTLLHGGDPVRGRRGPSRPSRCSTRPSRRSTGRPAVPVRSGGSIPIVPELGLTGAPVMLTGIGLPDDGLHSPNEKLDLAQLWSGIEVFGRFFELFAEKGGARRRSRRVRRARRSSLRHPACGESASTRARSSAPRCGRAARRRR